mgnify:CR=1 FL=1
MFGMSFMQLGLFSTIANAVGKAIAKVVGTIIEPMFRIIISMFMDVILEPLLSVILHSGLLGTVIDLLFNIIILGVQLLWNSLGLQEPAANAIINSANGIFKSMAGGEIINMMAWTPINFFNKGSSDITTTTANPYFLSLKLMTDGVMPTAMIIFSLIVLIELFQITVRTEGMRNSGFETPFKLMIKVAICKILLDNTQMVLEAIFITGTDLFKRLLNVATTLENQFNASTIKADLMKLPWYAIGVLYIQMGVQWLFIKIVMLVVPFLLFGRIMEMYIYITLAPIPFATFASQELSQIGKTFLKQFIGMSLKISVMYIIILVFSDMMFLMIFGTAEFSAGIFMDSFNWIIRGASTGNMLFFYIGLGEIAITLGVKPLIFAIMLLLAMMGSDKYVRAITGAWY